MVFTAPSSTEPSEGPSRAQTAYAGGGTSSRQLLRSGPGGQAIGHRMTLQEASTADERRELGRQPSCGLVPATCGAHRFSGPTSSAPSSGDGTLTRVRIATGLPVASTASQRPAPTLPLVCVPGRPLPPAFPSNRIGRRTCLRPRHPPFCGAFFGKSCGRCSEFGTTGEAVLRQTRERMTDQADSRHRRPDLKFAKRLVGDRGGEP